jgi:hypothetical protein
VTNSWVKSSQFCEICGYRKRFVKKNFSPLSFVAVFGSGIRDPGSWIRNGEKSGSGFRDKHPGSAKLSIIIDKNEKFFSSLKNMTMNMVLESFWQKCKLFEEEVELYHILHSFLWMYGVKGRGG